MPAPHHALSFFTDRMPFLPPNQQRQSTEGTKLKSAKKENSKVKDGYAQKYRLVKTVRGIRGISSGEEKEG